MHLSKLSRKDVLLGMVLLLLPIAFFPELTFFGKTLYREDINWIHYPLRVFVAQNWRAGNWPLWNPYSQCGIPLIAEAQVAALYPLNLLFVLPIPPYFALSCFVMLHLAMAALFTYVLGRSLRMGRAGALLAALSFGFGGVLTAQITNLNIVTGAAWMPLVLCLVIQAVERKSVTWAALSGLVLALQTLAAHPQVVFYTLILIVAYAAYRTLSLARSDALRKEIAWPGLLVALTIVIAFGLAAAQLLPTLEMLQQSIRSQGVGYAEMTLHSMSPLRLLSLLIPNLFGNPLLTSLGNFDELYVYLGTIPLLLSVGAWRRRDDPQVRFFILVLPLALLLSFGAYTPLYSVLQYLPGFNFFRVPARWIAVASLALALLGGYGLDELARENKATRPARTLLIVTVTLGMLMLGAALLVWLKRDEALAWVAGHSTSQDTREILSTASQRFLLPRTPQAPNWLLHIAPWVTIPGLVTLLQISILLGLLGAYAREKITAAMLSYALLGLTLLDLLAAGGTTITPVQDASYWQYDTATIALVREMAGTYRVHPVGVLSDEEWREPAHRALGWLMDYNSAVYGVPTPWGYISPVRLERFARFSLAVPMLRAADMMSVKLLLVWGELNPGAAAVFRAIHTVGELHIYENSGALPHAYLAHRVEVVPDGEAALRRLREDDFDPTQSAVVEGPVRGLSLSGKGITPATIRLYSPLRVIVESESPQDGLLVLTDSYYPGWRAFVDGQEEPILHGNYLFRALPVPAGVHTVEFVYTADSFKTGLLIGGAMAILVLLLIGARLFARLSSNQF
jgi:hypothetical protein